MDNEMNNTPIEDEVSVNADESESDAIGSVTDLEERLKDKFAPEKQSGAKKIVVQLSYPADEEGNHLIDEDALIDALREKRIAGAAFDVYASEPIRSNHPYITELDNVVITPHIAGATDEVLTNHTRMIVSDVKHFLRGEHLLYEYK